MNIGVKLYRVEQSEKGIPRTVLCGASPLETANKRLQSIAENMLANQWRRTDEINDKPLATVIMLTNGERTVVLAVKECTANDVTATKLDLREMNWLTRVPAQSFDIENDDTQEMEVSGETSEDVLDWLRDGSDLIEVEEAAQNG